uniref:SH3 domain-containing protein n=1 Tax=Steinernema glaseri TaxID=37863 RepID=A0A1I8ALR4_9BILA
MSRQDERLQQHSNQQYAQPSTSSGEQDAYAPQDPTQNPAQPPMGLHEPQYRNQPQQYPNQPAVVPMYRRAPQNLRAPPTNRVLDPVTTAYVPIQPNAKIVVRCSSNSGSLYVVLEKVEPNTRICRMYLWPDPLYWDGYQWLRTRRATSPLVELAALDRRS